MRTATFVILIAMLAGCAPASVGHSESVLERIEHETAVETVSVEIPLLLLEIDMVPVDWDSAEPFHTTARSEAIVKYPCSSCHETALEVNEPRSEAHWDIELMHAGRDVMSCTTCHQSDNLDTLHTLTGQPVEFDNSYQVCAQCHSTQVDDWAGGGHGKRVGGWAEPRVVENCVACHNPHNPAWDIRLPATTGGGVQVQEQE